MRISRRKESLFLRIPAAAVKAADEVVSLSTIPCSWRGGQLAGLQAGGDVYNRIKNRKRDVLTPDRLFQSLPRKSAVFDIMKLPDGCIPASSVARKNSGGNYATSFSNEYGSTRVHWAFTTVSTYQGTKWLFAHSRRTGERINDQARNVPLWCTGPPAQIPSVASRGGRLGTDLDVRHCYFRVAPHYRCNKGALSCIFMPKPPLALAQSSILDTSDDVIVKSMISAS